MTASLLAFALSVIISAALAVWVVVWTEWSDGVQIALATTFIVLGIAMGVFLYIGLIPWPASD